MLFKILAVGNTTMGTSQRLMPIAINALTVVLNFELLRIALGNAARVIGRVNTIIVLMIIGSR